MGHRDTDADWRELGSTNPYWAVLSNPEFQRENITPATLERFYQSGREDIAAVAREITTFTGASPSGKALDFGCGVGRLSEAMTAFASEVTGVDISPGMLDVARARGSRVSYVDQIPAGPFDWINSFIVFQHIPPERGEAILQELLGKLAPDGAVSLQMTVWREPHRLEWPEEHGLKRLLQKPRQWLWALREPVGRIHMYDYDLSRVVRMLNEAGVQDMRLSATNHGGHHGVIIIGRQTVAAGSRRDPA